MIGMRFMLFVALCIACPAAEISTLAGNGTAGFSEIQVNNPYGLALGPDGALYFCEIGNHCIRRLDLHTHTMTRVIGTGVKGNSGDGGVALMAEVNEPYEIRFDRAGNLFFVDMQSSVVRRVERNSGLISRVAGTGEAGFSGDGGLAVEAQFRQPHSIAFAPDGALLVCDIGNRRIRRIDLASGIITTFAGTGEKESLNGPRAIDFDPEGNLYLALREGNAIMRLDRSTKQWSKLPVDVSGPKGISYSPDGALYIADTESHRILRFDLKSQIATVAVGTGKRGDGPDGDPLKCSLSRPHGIFAAKDGVVYIGDSESHRVRQLVYSDHGRTR
jgi:streptogramin lyase